MKFPLIALTGAFASAKASTSRHIKLGKTRQLRRGDATTEALLNKAVPYKKKKKNHRQLDADAAAADDYVAEEANVDVGESSTISFGKCIDIKTKSDDLFDESIVTQVQNGNALSLTSFVLFNVCQDAYGYGCSEDNSDVYMIDLKTYFSVVGVKQASQRSDYCGQCQNNQDYCGANAYAGDDAVAAGDDAVATDDAAYADEAGEEAAGDDVAYADEDEEEAAGDDAEEEAQDDEQAEEAEDAEDNNQNDVQEEGNEDQDQAEEAQEEGADRKLKQQIDCVECNSLQCFDKDANDDSVANQAANRDIIDSYMAAWIEEVANCKQTTINGQYVYLGPICSEFGDTFEIGAFLDQDCTIHTKFATLDNIIAAEKANYSADVVQYAINALKTAFYEPMTCESQEFAEDDDDEEEEENEMSDYCKQLFENGAVNFNECAADEEEEQQDEDNEYSWYDFDMEDADENEEACAKIVSFNGVYSHYYDSESAGTVHTRYWDGSLHTESSTFPVPAISSLSVGANAAIAIASAVVLLGILSCLCKGCSRKKQDQREDLHELMYDGGKEYRTPKGEKLRIIT